MPSTKQQFKIVTLRPDEYESERIVALMDRFHESTAAKAIFRACHAFKDFDQRIDKYKELTDKLEADLTQLRLEAKTILRCENDRTTILDRWREDDQLLY